MCWTWSFLLGDNTNIKMATLTDFTNTVHSVTNMANHMYHKQAIDVTLHETHVQINLQVNL